MIEFNVKSIYYDPEHPILGKISFTVRKGEIVALTGASGVGKSTILKLIAGIHSGYQGKIVTPKDMRIAFISQNRCLLPWKTVYQNIILLRKIETKKVDKESAMELMRRLGLTGFEKTYPLRLSGGQYQRAALGQAFYYQPDIILMDEPFSALDEKTKKEVQDLFLQLQRQHQITALFVTHDKKEAEYLGSRVISLDDMESKEVTVE